MSPESAKHPEIFYQRLEQYPQLDLHLWIRPEASKEFDFGMMHKLQDMQQAKNPNSQLLWPMIFNVS